MTFQNEMFVAQRFEMYPPSVPEKSSAAVTIRGGTVDAVKTCMSAIISSSSLSRPDSIRRPGLRLVSNDHGLDEAATRASQESAKTAVIACLAAGSSSNNELLLKASAAALERDGEFYAVLLDSPRIRFKRSQVRTLIDAAIFASSLGAKIVWLDSSNPVGELLQFARQSRVGQIFVARNRPTLFSRLLQRTAYSNLLRHAEGCQIEVVGFKRRT
jgi:K+-sensing histidine kinase KdpD